LSTPQEKAKVRPRTATTFEKELWTFQNDAPKTPSSAMSNAGCVVGLGVFVWVVFFGLKFFGFSLEDFFKDSGALMGIVGILLLLLATFSPIIGAVLFLVALVRPKRSVKCPFCLADHSLYKPVRSYVCTECAAVLRIPSGTTTSDLVRVACPGCQTNWATPSNAGALRCFSCGLSVEVNEGQPKVAGQSMSCWSCIAQIREGVYFCEHCGCLVTEPAELPRYRVHTDLHEMIFKALPPTAPDGMDAISLRANSAVGFLVRALWRAQTVLNGLLASDEPDKKPTLAEQLIYLTSLDDAMDFLNETVTLEPDLAPAVHSALPIYDACVGLFTSRIEEKSQSSDISLKAAYKNLLKILPEKHNALLDSLNEMPNVKGGQPSSKKWRAPLFAPEESGNTVGVKDVDSLRSWGSRLTTPAQIGKIRVPEPALISIAKPGS